MAKRKINATEFVNDYKTGMTESQLQVKYELSAKQFKKLLENLEQQGRIELPYDDDTPPELQPTVELAYLCPNCGAMKLVDSHKCPQCGHVGPPQEIKRPHRASRPREGAAAPQSDSLFTDLTPAETEPVVDLGKSRTQRVRPPAEVRDTVFIGAIPEGDNPTEEKGIRAESAGPPDAKEKRSDWLRVIRTPLRLSILGACLAVVAGLATAVYLNVLPMEDIPLLGDRLRPRAPIPPPASQVKRVQPTPPAPHTQSVPKDATPTKPLDKGPESPQAQVAKTEPTQPPKPAESATKPVADPAASPSVNPDSKPAPVARTSADSPLPGSPDRPIRPPLTDAASFPSTAASSKSDETATREPAQPDLQPTPTRARLDKDFTKVTPPPSAQPPTSKTGEKPSSPKAAETVASPGDTPPPKTALGTNDKSRPVDGSRPSPSVASTETNIGAVAGKRPDPPSSEKETASPVTRKPDETSARPASPEKRHVTKPETDVAGERNEPEAIDPGLSLVRAVKVGDLTLTKRLLASGVNPDSMDSDGVTPLMTAVIQGREDLASLLLKAGANAKARNKAGDTALDMACRADPPASGIVSVLLAQDRAGAGRALIQAIRSGSRNTSAYLVENGADVNARDEEGATPLMIAAGMGRMEIVKFLLNKGAEVNARDKNGVTALGWAYAPPSEADVPLKLRREIVQLLKQSGARSGAIIGLD